ncbi:MAG: FAD-binding oxidoreductase [Alphaproteobacteria bacterium]|nr:FAD-binding oxidoreductase [Alphaproteobacteria bacterium]MDE2112238.1 FAD-binding oxidoreductase [Alphaproteobacteria bacterium]MDE2494170.1 FAD-binding oxidoreductase [Alphaproteobacteria bacterium]
MAHAVVVGGGIVGLAIAHRLLDCGVSVSLVDAPSREPSASWGNAGHIAIEQVAPLASSATICDAPRRLFSAHGGLSLPIGSVGAWAPFSLRLMLAARRSRYIAGKSALSALLAQATPAWERLVQSLEKPQLLRRDGHFITWSTAKSAAAGRRHWLSADVGSASIRDTHADELRELRALVTKRIVGAVRCSGSGQIYDPDELLQAMRRRFTGGGGAFIPAHIAHLRAEAGKARVYADDGQMLAADFLVVAGGIGSRSLLEGVGHRVPMIAERGYHVQFRAENWPADMPPVVFEDRAMIATRFSSVVRVAGFVEFCDAERPADERKWQRLEQNIKELDLPLDHRVGNWMGSRPTLPDYLPAIGKSRRARNLFYAFGHQHLGLTLAPITGEIMAALVTDRTPAVSISPFDLERFL